MRNSLAILGLALAGSVFTTGHPSAQALFAPEPLASIDFTSPEGLDRLLITGSITAPSLPEVTSSGAAQTVAASRAAAPRLAAFEQPASALRLSGEAARADLTFYADATTAGLGGKVHLAYRNAVSVMPESSSVAVSVNETAIGTFPVRSPMGFTSVDFDVPPSALKVGTNRVVIQAVQHHRVDCSMPATYELWTEFDSLQSGFLSRTARPYSDFADLRAIGRNASGVTELRLIVGANAGAAAVERAMPLIQTVALLIGRPDVTVTLADGPGEGPGVDVILGLDEDQASLKLLPAAAPLGLSVSQSADPDRAVVALRAGSANQISGILLEAVRGKLKPLLKDAQHSEEPGIVKAEARSSFKFSDIGYQASAFAGRLFRTDLTVDMPSDFYPGDYASVDLMLHAATSPGLNPKSQLLVRINDEIVKSLPMRDKRGQVFSGRRVELPLRAFHPGRNRVEILAEVPTARDEACNFVERDENAARFILLGNTELRFPPLARISRLPELAATMGDAYPYADGAPLTVYSATADANSISAAATMLTRLSLSAGMPINAQLSIGLPDETAKAGNSIVVASGRALDDYQRMGAAQFNSGNQSIRFAQTQAVDNIQTSAIGIDPAALRQVTVDPNALLEAFRTETRNNSDFGDFQSFGENLSNWMTDFRNWLKYNPNAGGVQLDGGARLATIRQAETRDGSGVTTWLTAQTPADLADATVAFGDPEVWNRLQGESAAIDIDKRQVKSERPARYFDYRVTEYGPANLRRVAAAWLSDHFRFYVMAVLGLMAILAIWLGHAVPTFGVRTDK